MEGALLGGGRCPQPSLLTVLAEVSPFPQPLARSEAREISQPSSGGKHCFQGSRSGTSQSQRSRLPSTPEDLAHGFAAHILWSQSFLGVS